MTPHNGCFLIGCVYEGLPLVLPTGPSYFHVPCGFNKTMYSVDVDVSSFVFGFLNTSLALSGDANCVLAKGGFSKGLPISLMGRNHANTTTPRGSTVGGKANNTFKESPLVDRILAEVEPIN